MSCRVHCLSFSCGEIAMDLREVSTFRVYSEGFVESRHGNKTHQCSFLSASGYEQTGPFVSLVLFFQERFLVFLRALVS